MRKRSPLPIGMWHRAVFRMRWKVLSTLTSLARKQWYALLGMRFGRGSVVSKLEVTWPHQVSIGEHCTFESGIYFKYDGTWRDGTAIRIGDRNFFGRNVEFNIRHALSIGSDCLVASGCSFIDHDHGMTDGVVMREQDGPGAPIKLDDDVWLGCNVVVLKGVTIGRGAVVAAGAVLTRSVPPFEIWGGVPARRIGARTGEST